MPNAVATLIDFARNVMEKEAARIATYGAGLVLAGAVWLGRQAQWELSAEVQGAVTFLALAIIGEVIRRFVFSKATTAKIANNATYLPPGTPVDVGNPPEGPFTG